MAIKNVVLRGYGNGTVAGTAALVVTRGYGVGEAAVVTDPGTVCGAVKARPAVGGGVATRPAVGGTAQVEEC